MSNVINLKKAKQKRADGNEASWSAPSVANAAARNAPSSADWP